MKKLLLKMFAVLLGMCYSSILIQFRSVSLEQHADLWPREEFCLPTYVPTQLHVLSLWSHSHLFLLLSSLRYKCHTSSQGSNSFLRVQFPTARWIPSAKQRSSPHTQSVAFIWPFCFTYRNTDCATKLVFFSYEFPEHVFSDLERWQQQSTAKPDIITHEVLLLQLLSIQYCPVGSHLCTQFTIISSKYEVSSFTAISQYLVISRYYCEQYN